MDTKTTKAKPSQFLRTLDPHTIYDAGELAMDYAKEVGRSPCWPIHSSKRAQIDVMLRKGKDCWMNTSQPLLPVAYGYEVAEAIAKAHVADFKFEQAGDFKDMRGLYEESVAALEEIGL